MMQKRLNMKMKQTVVRIKAPNRGFYLITDKILEAIKIDDIQMGVMRKKK